MHKFAKYIQILGKGKNGMRPLGQEEAYEAMRMIACYDVEPEQVGAFLMLMRVKEETAEEVAGFARAIRESIPLYQPRVIPAIDWSAYAGKKRQLPWFVLAALILARRGYPVFMHGMSREDERIYVPEVLVALDIDMAGTLAEAETHLADSGFAYLPIDQLSPLTAELIQTRELFGLRPPLHTVARMLNPLSAPLTVMGVFHPNYAEIHQQAAQLMGQQNTLICKGEGGEFERVPDRSVDLYGVSEGTPWLEQWEARLKAGSILRPEQLKLDDLLAVWNGDRQDAYGELAVIGTLAWVIRALGIETSQDAAHQLAALWWERRHQMDTVRKVEVV
jgi:anthranilate phosphoribosyltransferase